MKHYYCLEVKFKNSDISSEKYHAHLYTENDEIYFKIIIGENSDVERKFLMDHSSFFDQNFEVETHEFELVFQKSKIYKVKSLDGRGATSYITVYIDSVCLIKPNIHKDAPNKGKVYLNKNGLKVTNLFYAFFNNLKDRNSFSISRMNSMTDYYPVGDLQFRPELEFTSNEKRNSSEFTVKKIPTLNFTAENFSFETIQLYNSIICRFLSFCFGIRVSYNTLIYKTKESIYIYKLAENDSRTYVSDFLPIFRFVSDSFRVENMLQTNWAENYLKNSSRLNKGIENYLHSREVDLSSAFLLLFNIIEIFNVQGDEEVFQFNSLKEQNFQKAYDLIEASLDNNDDAELLQSKWNGLINKISIKPMSSPLEQTLILNNINCKDFGFTFPQLKKVRDKLTHGSINSIKEEVLRQQVYCLRKISSCLILSHLGFSEQIKTAHNPG